MTTNHLDPASLAWGLALGVTFGAWLRGTLDALFLNPRRRMGPPQGSHGLLDPPPDVAAAINHQLDQDIAAELDRRRRRRGSNPPTKPQPHGGRIVGDDLCPPPPPIKPQFPPPRIIREDFLP
jgi:hypothetical protein